MKVRESVDGLLHHGRSIEVKSLVVGMLVMGLFVFFQGNVLRYIRPGASFNQRRSDQLPIIKSVAQENTSRVEQELLEQPMHVLPGPVNGDPEDRFVIRRDFRAYGSAGVLFVEMGAYRGGPDSFAVVGLGSKPVHVYGDAGFECEWAPSGRSGVNSSVKGKVWKLLPDWNMGRQYTVVVVNCSFAKGVGIDGKGGELVLYASHGQGTGEDDDSSVRVVALTEKAGEYSERKFRPPYPYDFVFCGSPLFGTINPQRMREWIAYHVKLFGPRSHFFFHDSGGLSQEIRQVLQPWLELGFLTIYDIRQEARFDGYYKNQFLVINDCFHRTRFLSNWTFVFDVDEFLYVPPRFTLHSLMDGFSNYSQVIYEQNPMSISLCEASRNYSRKWAIEKLIYRNIKKDVTWDRKYAIQPRTAFTAGVHRSDHILGESLGYFPDSHVPYLRFYHFHDLLTVRGELCKEFVNSTGLPTESAVFFDSKEVPFTIDRGLQRLAKSVKKFERKQIGRQPTMQLDSSCQR